MIAGLPFRGKDWDDLFKAPALFNSDGVCRAKPTQSQKEQFNTLRRMQESPSEVVRSYLRQPSFRAKKLGSLPEEEDSDGSTTDASTVGGALDRKRMREYEALAMSDLSEYAREVANAKKATEQPGNGGGLPSSRCLPETRVRGRCQRPVHRWRSGQQHPTREQPARPHRGEAQAREATRAQGLVGRTERKR